MRFGGERGESVFFEGNSPINGQKEYVWMVAAMRPQGLFHLLMISPQNEYDNYSKTFEGIVRSVDFNDKYRAPQAQTQAPPKAPTGGQPTAPQVVSGVYSGDGYSFAPPQGWKLSRHQSSAGVTVLPENGVVGQGIARGVIAGYFDGGASNQWDSLSKLIQDLIKKNPGFKEMDGYRRAMSFGGANGESVFLEGPSPIQGQKEYIWIAAAKTPRGLFNLLMIAPESEYGNLSATFEEVVRSVELDLR